MTHEENQGTMCAITEQGDLGLGVHQGSNEQERAELQRRLNEMQRQTTGTQQTNSNQRR